jgi:hypothetical protein
MKPLSDHCRRVDSFTSRRWQASPRDIQRFEGFLVLSDNAVPKTCGNLEKYSDSQ